MLKYYLLKIRYFLACILAVLIVCSAVIVGGIVGLIDDRKQALEKFDGGILREGIQELLVYRADTVNQIAKLYLEYFPENKTNLAAIDNFISLVQDESDIKALTESERVAKEAISRMIDQLQTKKLNSSDQAKLDNYIINLNENLRDIIESDYNKISSEYNKAISSFPGNIYAKYFSLEPLYQFG